jgi:hypothetical protein
MQLEFLASNADAIEQVKDLLQQLLAEQKKPPPNAVVVYGRLLLAHPVCI